MCVGIEINHLEIVPWNAHWLHLGASLGVGIRCGIPLIACPICACTVCIVWMALSMETDIETNTK